MPMDDRAVDDLIDDYERALGEVRDRLARTSRDLLACQTQLVDYRHALQDILIVADDREWLAVSDLAKRALEGDHESRIPL